MEYAIGYYSDNVEKDILALPDTLAARYIVLARRNRTPPRELKIALNRMKEVKHGHA